MSWEAVSTEGYEIVTFYSPTERRWVSMLRDPATKRFIRRLRTITVRVSLSIETGKPKPLIAEITASTMAAPAGRPRVEYLVRRIVNAALKLIYLYFDVRKDFPEAKGMPEVLAYVRRLLSARVLSERWIDATLRALMRMNALKRPVEQYFAHQAVMKVGVEVGGERAPPFPYVRFEIERRERRGEPARGVGVNTVRLRPRTVVNMLRILEIELEWEWRRP